MFKGKQAKLAVEELAKLLGYGKPDYYPNTERVRFYPYLQGDKDKLPITKHPETGKFEQAQWLDDTPNHHEYSVRFPDGKLFEANKYEWEFKDYRNYGI